MNILSVLITVPLAILALCFTLGNRGPTLINLWPFGAEVAVPVYMLALVPLAIGLVSGAAFIWTGGLRHRLAARRLGQENSKLREELLKMHRTMGDQGAEKPKSILARWRM